MNKGMKSTIIVAGILSVLGLLALLFSNNIMAFSTNLISGIYHTGTCSLGVYGTAANITLTGGESECESIRELSVRSNGKTVLYVMTTTPTGNVICEGDTQDGYPLYCKRHWFTRHCRKQPMLLDASSHARILNSSGPPTITPNGTYYS